MLYMLFISRTFFSLLVRSFSCVRPSSRDKFSVFMRSSLEKKNKNRMLKSHQKVSLSLLCFPLYPLLFLLLPLSDCWQSWKHRKPSFILFYIPIDSLTRLLAALQRLATCVQSSKFFILSRLLVLRHTSRVDQHRFFFSSRAVVEEVSVSPCHVALSSPNNPTGERAKRTRANNKSTEFHSTRQHPLPPFACSHNIYFFIR